MQLSIPALEDYLSRIAEMLERCGVVLALEVAESLVLDEAPSGTLSFELRGSLPDGRTPPLATIEVRERWRRLAPDIAERWEYEYELLDHERGFRRAVDAQPCIGAAAALAGDR